MANRESPRKENRPKFSEEVIKVLDAFVSMGILSYSKPDDIYFKYDWFSGKMTYVDFELEKQLFKTEEEQS